MQHWPGTVLVVNDEPVLRKLLSRMMQLEAYDVCKVEDKKSA